jgi:hypothetical protein
LRSFFDSRPLLLDLDFLASSFFSPPTTSRSPPFLRPLPHERDIVVRPLQYAPVLRLRFCR